MTAPRRSAAAARPQASLAGLSITVRSAPARTPARKRGEWTSACTAARSRYSSSVPCRADSSTHSSSSGTCHGSVATSSTPVGSRSQSIASSRTNATSSSRFRRPSSSRTSISPGKCSRPLPRPCVREAAQNPPLRPLAPGADPVRLEDGDAQRRVGLEQADRRPQPGEAGADDRDVDRGPSRGRGPDRARVAGREPVAAAGGRVGRGRRDGGGRGVRRHAGQCTRIWRRSRPCGCGIRRITVRCRTIFVLTAREALWHDRAQSFHCPQRAFRATRLAAGPPGRRPSRATPSQPRDTRGCQAWRHHDRRTRRPIRPRAQPGAPAGDVPSRAGDAAGRHGFELPGLGRGHDLRRSRQGRPRVGHRRQRVHRPAHGLWAGDPGPRRRAGRRLRQRAHAPGRQLLAHERGRGPGDGARQGAQPVGLEGPDDRVRAPRPRCTRCASPARSPGATRS